MDDEVFVETTSTGWFYCIGSSIKGVLFGLVLLVVSVGLLWWNDGRSVKTVKGLAEGAQVTVEESSGTVESAKDGKLLYVIGKTTVKQVAKDDQFGVAGPDVLKLKRRVEAFQWFEDNHEDTRKKLGGGEETVTEYRYNKKWDDQLHDSSQFKHLQGHENPAPKAARAEFLAPDASLGAFRLPEFPFSQRNDYQPHNLPAVNALQGQAWIQDKWLVLSATPADPQVGDARVQFESIKTGDASAA